MSAESQDTAKPTAPRWGLRVAIGLGAVAVVALALLAARVMPIRHRFYTDADTIKTPAADAPLRDILWQPARPLPWEIINTTDDDYEPRLSADGLTLFFVRGKAGRNADIYFSQAAGDGWTEPEPILGVNSSFDDLGPEPSADGKSLYFYSDRPGGFGGYDLWVAHRGADGWQSPTHLGPTVNSEFNDYGPALTPDGRGLYFASNRPMPGDEDHDPDAWPATLREDRFHRHYDLYLAAVTERGVGLAQPLIALNTPYNEGAPAVSPFGDFLYFGSDRPGGQGGFDLYRARRLHGGYERVENLGPAVNTAANELDPGLSLGGYALHFSSNRTRDESRIGDPRVYNLYYTTSREVFADAERMDRPPIDWAAFWSAFGPSLLWALFALLALLLLLLLLAIMRGMAQRRLSLLTKCLLASLLAHLLLLLLLTLWQVTTALAGYSPRGGAIRVALAPSAQAGEIEAQIRGRLTAFETPGFEPLQVARQATAVPMQPASVTATLSVRRQPLEVTQTDIDLTFTPTDAAVERTRDLRDSMETPIDMDHPFRLDPTTPDDPVPLRGVESERPSPIPKTILHPADRPPINVEASANRLSTPATLSPSPTKDTDPLRQRPESLAMATLARDARPKPTAQTRSTEPAAPVAPTAMPALALATDRVEPSSIVAEPSARVRHQPVTTSRQPLTIPTESRPPPEARVQLTPSVAGHQQDADALESLMEQAPIHDAQPLFPKMDAYTGPAPMSERHSENFALPPLPTAIPTDVAAVFSSNAQPPGENPLEPGGPITERAHQSEPLRAALSLAATDDTAPPPIEHVRPERIQPAGAQRSLAGDPVEQAVDTAVPADIAKMNFAFPASQSITDDASSINALVRVGESFAVPSVPDLPLSPLEDDAPASPTSERAAMLEPVPPGSVRPSIETLLLGRESASMPFAQFTQPQRFDVPPTRDLGADADLESLMEAAPLGEPSLWATRADSIGSVRALLSGTAEDAPDSDILPPALFLLETSLPDEELAPQSPYLHRDPDDRMDIVKRMGGSKETEQAVARALNWLIRHQDDDGHWDGDGFDENCGRCGGETEIVADIALTGLSTLCFLGAGHTHTADGPFQSNVEEALRWLVEHLESDGDLRNGETMYSQGIAAIALSEAYAMTGDETLKDPVQRAVQFIVRARHRAGGGWRYDPGQMGDTSVLGWQLMALKSASMTGLFVPRDAFETARAWLDRVSRRSPGLYAYTPNRAPTPSMTAEGMFVQQLLGSDRSQPRMRESADFILRHLPDWEADPSTYFWYYASLALFQHQGKEWTRWNNALTRELLAHQRSRGRPDGSWDPVDRWSMLGGRVYQTALCTLMLEVYYRYLPLYTLDAVAMVDQPEVSVGTIHGRVTDGASGEPIANAVVRLNLAGEGTAQATTDQTGRYVLPAPEVPDHFALSASGEGFLPSTADVEAAMLESGALTVDFTLDPIQANVVAIEAVPDVHHLGDNRFDGRINSQFQKESEGSSYTAEFELLEEQLSPQVARAEVRLWAKGVQRRHRIYINGTELDQRLDDAPSDGGFGEFVAPFDVALLRPGTNTLKIVAAPSSSDIDDFEFVNVQIRLLP